VKKINVPIDLLKFQIIIYKKVLKMIVSFG